MLLQMPIVLINKAPNITYNKASTVAMSAIEQNVQDDFILIAT